MDSKTELKPPVEDYSTRISKGRGAYYSPPSMTYSLSIILDPKFKQIMTFNRRKFLNEMEFFDTEGKNNISDDDIKASSSLSHDIYSHAEFFINSYTLSIIDYYYIHDLTLPFPSFGNTYKYMDTILYSEDTSFDPFEDTQHLLLTYYTSISNLYYNILRSNVVSVIYKNITEFPDEKNTFKFGYNNTRIDHKLDVDIDISEYEVNSNPVLKHLQISKRFDILDNVQNTIKMYNTGTKNRRLRDAIFSKFTILYLTHRFKDIICQSIVRESILSYIDITSARNVVPIFMKFTGFEITINVHKNMSILHIPANRILKNHNITSTNEVVENGIVVYEYDINLKRNIYNCQSKYIILNIGLFDSVMPIGHANILIYKPAVKDTRTGNVTQNGEVEIFDSQVSKDSTRINIYTRLVDNLFPKGTKYVNIHLKNEKTLQSMQEAEQCTIETGHCATWTHWYAAQRLGHPDLNARKAHDLIYAKVNKLVTEHADSPGYNPLSALVKNYTDYIWSQRAFILTKSDIPNEFKNWFRKEWKLYPYSQK